MLIRYGFICLLVLFAESMLMAQDSAHTKVLFEGPGNFKTFSGKAYQEKSWKLCVDDYIYKDFYPVLKDKNDYKEPKMPAPGKMHPTVGFKKFVDTQFHVNRTFFSCRVLETKRFDQLDKNFQSVKSVIDLTDWRGHEVLRVDIKSKGDLALWWCLIDAYLQPPIVGNFTLKKDTWYTLEFDLDEAVKKRKLDLSDMQQTWLGTGPGALGSIANLRLEKRSVKTTYPVLKDPKAFDLPDLPEKVAAPKLDIKADVTPLKETKLLTFNAAWETRLNDAKSNGLVAIFDQNHVFVLHKLYEAYPRLTADSKVKRTQYNKPLSELFAAQTFDGGKTWVGMKGDKEPTFIYTNRTERFKIIDNRGDIISWNNNGCGSKPFGPWQRMRKYSFEGTKGWTRWKQDRVLEEEARHCTHGTMDFVRTPDGRIWGALGVEGRWAPPNFINVHAKFSDTDGKHWISWNPGFTSRIPEMTDQHPAGIVPFGKHVAVVKRNHFKSKEPAAWTYFDGKKWVKPMTFPTNYINSVESVGKNNETIVVATYTKGLGVVSWDGESWNTELDENVKLCKSGDTLMALAVDDKKNELNVYHRLPDGKWIGPEVIGMEATTDIYIPRFCPANLAAVAYVPKENKKQIKVLMVPNKLWKEAQ